MEVGSLMLFLFEAYMIPIDYMEHLDEQNT